MKDTDPRHASSPLLTVIFWNQSIGTTSVPLLAPFVWLSILLLYSERLHRSFIVSTGLVGAACPGQWSYPYLVPLSLSFVMPCSSSCSPRSRTPFDFEVSRPPNATPQATPSTSSLNGGTSSLKTHQVDMYVPYQKSRVAPLSRSNTIRLRSLSATGLAPPSPSAAPSASSVQGGTSSLRRCCGWGGCTPCHAWTLESLKCRDGARRGFKEGRRMLALKREAP